MKLAIVGATGVVGREILEVISERRFPFTELFLVASERSCGKSILFEGKPREVISLSELLNKNVDLALFSAGQEIAKNWAPKLAAMGCRVVDNSSYWRMCSKHKLIIPEINGNQLLQEDFIIANPNCSTIQLAMVLAPLHERYVAKRAVVSTYQAVSGSGKKAIKQLKNEQNNTRGEMFYLHQIFQNVLPQCDDFAENGYTKEEMKITNEIKKIIDKNIDVVATAVRVPVFRGHSESVNITFENKFNVSEIRHILSQTSGVTVLDIPERKEYPMPINTSKKDEVFVGRIRKDFTQKNTLNVWIVADNLRKGAATNTVQIAEYLIATNFV